MLDHHLIERLIIALGDQGASTRFIKGAGLFQERQECAAAIVQVSKPMVSLGRSKWMHIKADEFALGTVAIALEGAHLVESAAKIGAAKRFVLVKFQAVLIVQMQRPQLAETHGKIDFISGIKSGQDAMGGFDERPDSFGIGSQLGDGQGMADGRNVGVIHRFIGLGFDGQAGTAIVSEHLVESLDEQFDAALSIFGFAQVSAFAGQPEHDQIGAEDSGDIQAAKGSVDGILAAFFVVAGISAIDGHWGKPEPGGDHFSNDAFAIELFLQFLGLLADLSIGLVVDVWNGIVVMKHHGVEPEILELSEFPVEVLRRPSGGAIRV